MDIQRLADIVGADGVLTGDDVRARSVSWADHSPCQALAIVRPANTEQVSRVLAACHAAGQAVVPMGGLTGLVRGCVAGPGEIGLSLERMHRIESVDPVNRTMTLEAGVPLETVQQEAEKHGLLYPVDFGARGSAHIGATVATNAGGNGVIRYGMTRDSVLGLEAVLADGTSLPTFRANHAFQGVAISQAGPFQLDLTYANPLIWWLNLASLFGLGLMFSGAAWGPRAQAAGQTITPEPPALATLSWRASMLAGVISAAIWAAAFALFVMGRQKGAQAESFPYALATIPVLGVLVACWTRSFLRRF